MGAQVDPLSLSQEDQVDPDFSTFRFNRRQHGLDKLLAGGQHDFLRAESPEHLLPFEGGQLQASLQQSTALPFELPEGGHRRPRTRAARLHDDLSRQLVLRRRGATG